MNTKDFLRQAAKRMQIADDTIMADKTHDATLYYNKGTNETYVRIDLPGGVGVYVLIDVAGERLKGVAMWSPITPEIQEMLEENDSGNQG